MDKKSWFSLFFPTKKQQTGDAKSGEQYRSLQDLCIQHIQQSMQKMAELELRMARRKSQDV